MDEDRFAVSDELWEQIWPSLLPVKPGIWLMPVYLSVFSMR